MLKKLNFALITLLSIFIFSCNFTFNDPKTLTQTASLSISCGSKNARTISEKDKQEGILKIHILGEKTNHYVYREGNTNSTFYFDQLPEDTYLIKVDFYVSNILKATAEDFVEIKAFNTKSITLTLIEVSSRYPTNAIYPRVISNWADLKTHIEATENYSIYVIDSMDIGETISITRDICLLATNPVTLNCVKTNTAFTVTNSSDAKLTIATENSGKVIIQGNIIELENSLFVANGPLELNNVEVSYLISKKGGGVITSRNHVILNNCMFGSIETQGNGAVVYCDGGSLTVKGEYLSADLSTKLINNTAFNEDFYLIANNNPVYTFEGVDMDGVTMYIQCNNKPTLIVDQNCINNKNTLYFSSEIEATEEEINMWSRLFNNITHGDKLLYPKI